jgi:hypothetical protein
MQLRKGKSLAWQDSWKIAELLVVIRDGVAFEVRDRLFKYNS